MSERKHDIAVSIIIPTFNRADLIAETVESIRQQTFADWELIIVDDGSSDNTEEVCKNFNDPRITYHKIIHSGIGGLTKNYGIQRSKGEFIAFNDSDDLWEENKLKKQMSALMQFPQAGFSLSNGFNFKVPSVPVDYFNQRNEGIECSNIFIPLFQSKIAAFAQTLLFRRSCIEKIGLFKEEGSFSDIDFIAKLALHFPAVILFEPLVFRRIHGGNYIHANWEKSYWDGISLIEDFEANLPATVYRSAMYNAFINYGQKCLLYKQPAKARKLFLRAWKFQPASVIPLKEITRSFFRN
jgi:glycosyltransferase involved in cell wall biosynthesis